MFWPIYVFCGFIFRCIIVPYINNDIGLLVFINGYSGELILNRVLLYARISQIQRNLFFAFMQIIAK